MKLLRVFREPRGVIRYFARRNPDRVARIIARLLPPDLMRNRRYFPLWEKNEYHVTPVHFYWPIPDTRVLKEDLWEKPSALVGIDMNDEGQLALLASFHAHYHEEYERFPVEQTDDPLVFHLNNEGFNQVDAEVLYSMVRHYKPKRIIEIGSGNSTLVITKAVLQNKKEGHDCHFTAIEPHPGDPLKNDIPGLTDLIMKPVEEVDINLFAELGDHDILFIDSSHVLKIGSDVQYEFLEVLPRLNHGVFVHVHDIFFPFEYPKAWLYEKKRYWNEQYLLQAFLMFNDAFEVIWSSSFMLHHYEQQVVAAIESAKHREHGWPASFWMRRTS